MLADTSPRLQLSYKLALELYYWEEPHGDFINCYGARCDGCIKPHQNLAGQCILGWRPHSTHTGEQESRPGWLDKHFQQANLGTRTMSHQG